MRDDNSRIIRNQIWLICIVIAILLIGMSIAGREDMEAKQVQAEKILVDHQKERDERAAMSLFGIPSKGVGNGHH